MTGALVQSTVLPETGSAEPLLELVELPGLASAPLGPDDVNVVQTEAPAPDPEAEEPEDSEPRWDGNVDGDAACTGTILAPTAPAGKVCIYLGDPSSNVLSVSGVGSYAQARGSFAVSYVVDGTGGNTRVPAVWAYTAG